MDRLTNEQNINILYAIVAFFYCLILAILLFVIKLWLDVYHNRFFEFVNKNSNDQIELLKLLHEEVKKK